MSLVGFKRNRRSLPLNGCAGLATRLSLRCCVDLATRLPLRCCVGLATRAFANQSSELSGDENYWTNGGIVEGIWMFSRHGDRTPARPLSPKHRQREEAAYWVTKLPVPDSKTVFENYSNHYPVKRMGEHDDSFFEVKRNPFGFLTSKGLSQLQERGRRFFNRYNKHARHSPSCVDWQCAQDFLSDWQMNVYSTNYLRTILSAQSFLDGMFNTNCYTHGRDRDFDYRSAQEKGVPTIGTCSCNDSPDHLVSIQVRDWRHDPLNAFERNPDLIDELSADVMLSDEFLEKDGQAAFLAANLASHLPGLVKDKSTDYAARTPSGINWVEAADHFVCREAHAVELSRFSDFENDNRTESFLQAMSHPTLAHLAWRFRQWYKSDRLLAVIAAPPLREITDQILHAPNLADNERRPFVIYSCHDITILGLLYAIGADVVSSEKGASRYWPPYGSNLVFELVRVRDGPPSLDTHIVRILLNGVPIRSLKLDGSKKASFEDGGGMLTLQDLEKTVESVESAGGFDYESLLGHK